MYWDSETLCEIFRPRLLLVSETQTLRVRVSATPSSRWSRGRTLGQTRWRGFWKFDETVPCSHTLLSFWHLKWERLFYLLTDLWKITFCTQKLQRSLASRMFVVCSTFHPNITVQEGGCTAKSPSRKTLELTPSCWIWNLLLRRKGGRSERVRRPINFVCFVRQGVLE